ncbi:MAG: bifunctional 4-hydroxy-2-oxoglutarate aldolase/2-dehydro-3-deoxy-phosphogluconate aldolase [Phycisphaeraceae bacterium]|nr:MAG: bifunctional 4-hydroxy-2-oxoglutarate aldolase/2-dehydro-3-deoxy-phosphogluconate aldolase [Phycisphaeraceae bacterium]
MTSDDFLRFFSEARASAILRTNLRDAAAPAMEAAIRGGFRVCEFTLTVPGALDLIREFSKRPEIVVGAGTVLTPQEAHAAVDAGAVFLVSPVVDEAVIAAALERDAAVMPGTFTPTEMLRAHRAGARLQKLFPAPDSGPKYLKAVLGPMPFLNVVPTNGVHENNAAAWLKAGAFAVGFVNTLFDPNDLAAGDYERVEQRARAAIGAVGRGKTSG